MVSGAVFPERLEQVILSKPKKVMDTCPLCELHQTNLTLYLQVHLYVVHLHL